MKYDYYKEMKRDIKDYIADFSEGDKQYLLDLYEEDKVDDFLDYLTDFLINDGIAEGEIYTEDAWSHICDNIAMLTSAIQRYGLGDSICETLKGCGFDFKTASLDFDCLLKGYVLDNILTDMIETEPETLIKYLK